MVLAVRPVVSASRLAARPVGAASTHFSFLAVKISRMLRTSVVLPTPGPPVMTSIFCWHACRIASCCPAASLMPSLPSTQAMAFSTSIARQRMRRGRGDPVDGLGQADLGPVQSRQVKPGLAVHGLPDDDLRFGTPYCTASSTICWSISTSLVVCSTTPDSG